MKTVVISGASTGLGLALSQRLLTLPYRLVLTARAESMDRFAEAGIVETERVRIRPLDVTRAAERRALVEEVVRGWGGIDVLINNAGISYRAVVEHVQVEEQLQQMDVNFRAPMALIRLVLPSMRAKRAGRIINISSVGGMMAMPTMAAAACPTFGTGAVDRLARASCVVVVELSTQWEYVVLKGGR